MVCDFCGNCHDEVSAIGNWALVWDVVVKDTSTGISQINANGTKAAEKLGVRTSGTWIGQINAKETKSEIKIRCKELSDKV